MEKRSSISCVIKQKRILQIIQCSMEEPADLVVIGNITVPQQSGDDRADPEPLCNGGKITALSYLNPLFLKLVRHLIPRSVPLLCLQYRRTVRHMIS